jgi:hypothetical protein
VFGLVIGFIDHAHIVTASTYGAIANSHTLQFITARTKSSVCCVLTSRYLLTAFNAVASSASVFTSLLAGECLTTDWTVSESYITTDGQSASLSWNKAPIWHLGPDLYYCQTVAPLLMWGALSDERTGLSFTIAAGLQRSHSRVPVPLDSWPYITLSDSILPFSSPPKTRRVTVGVFDPASTRESDWTLDLPPRLTPRHGLHRNTARQNFICCVTQPSHGPRRKHRWPYSLLAHVRNLFPSNGLCLHSYYFATGLHGTIWTEVSGII